MEIQKLDENLRPFPDSVVRVKEMGDILEIMYSEKRSTENVIKKISATHYIDKRTGEVKEFTPIDNRSQALNDVRKSLGRLRDYINTNVDDVNKCKWITLTYRENMTDTKKLYDDFKKFNMRFKYQMSKHCLTYEYIVAMEPQGRGAWHAHLLMIFDKVPPFIDNSIVSEIWGHGFTVTKKLDNVDNVGAYLTAYLGDMDMSDYKYLNDEEKDKVKIHSIKEVEHEGVSKAIIKGARLYMYPPKFNIYRCSRGIKKPVITYDLEENAQKKISAATLTFERTIKLTDSDSDYTNHINYRYYNKKRK